MGGWGDKIRQNKIAVGQEFPCLWCSLQWWAGQLCSSVHSLFFSNMSVVKQMSKQAAAASFNLIPSCGKACPAAAGRVWRGSSPFLTCFFLTSNFSSSSPISSSHRPPTGWLTTRILCRRKAGGCWQQSAKVTLDQNVLMFATNIPPCLALPEWTLKLAKVVSLGYHRPVGTNG